MNGGWVFGQKNVDGEKILELAETYDLPILNKFFKKKDENILT